jgi:hypothetical protein
VNALDGESDRQADHAGRLVIVRASRLRDSM